MQTPSTSADDPKPTSACRCAPIICAGVHLSWLILSTSFKVQNKPDSLNQTGPLFPTQAKVTLPVGKSPTGAGQHSTLYGRVHPATVKRFPPAGKRAHPKYHRSQNKASNAHPLTPLSAKRTGAFKRLEESAAPGLPDGTGTAWEPPAA
jgi:hypothetical protein